jgi:nucleoside-diphosphate-sugar epimerase
MAAPRLEDLIKTPADLASFLGQTTKYVCVIGASGFIGKKATERLRLAGYQIRATVRFNSQIPDELKEEGVEIVFADVRNKTSITKACQGCSIVINAAGIYRWWVPDKSIYKQVNDTGARIVAEVCAELEIQHLIHISTAMAYGYPDEKPFTETSASGPFAADYTRTKADGDKAVLQVHALHHFNGNQTQSDFRLDILYLGCVTGTGDTFSVGRPAAVYRDFMQGKIPMLVAPDTNYIYVAVDDVCTAILTVCEQGATDTSKRRWRANRYLIANSDEVSRNNIKRYIPRGEHTHVSGRKQAANRTCGCSTSNFSHEISLSIF